jgi:hypothetical protein
MSSSSLAIDGGPPIRTAAFAPWPFFHQEDIEAATAPLASGKVNYWTGQEGRRFEDEFAAFTGSGYAIALANGTVALELALRALGIVPGDQVITTSRTFIASASSIVMCGATPVIADVDTDSQNITAETVAPLINDKTRAIIAVHLAGRSCDMDPLLALACKHNLKVVEDCAQAHGATYKGRPVGSMGDVAAFSFCQDKIMTTGGEGGMLLTDDLDLWERAWAFKDHGKSYDAVYYREHPAGFRWLHESFGTNWRMSEMQAAIGRVQLRKLPEWTRIRQRNAAILEGSFSRIPALRITPPPPEAGHAYYKYYVFVRPEKLKQGWGRDRIMKSITAEGIPCYSGSCSEIYREKAFTEAGFGPVKRLPTAHELGKTSLMFMVHPTLTEQDMKDVCSAVEKVFGHASQ